MRISPSKKPRGFAFSRRWSDRGGFAEVLRLAAPLILSTGSLAVQEIVDRMFLGWYSPQAIAASMPSGILYFTILSVFLGTASYVNTSFVFSRANGSRCGSSDLTASALTAVSGAVYTDGQGV